MRLRIGVQLDPLTGRPLRPLYLDEAPGRARPSALTGTPTYSGSLVVGRSGAGRLWAGREAQRRYRERQA